MGCCSKGSRGTHAGRQQAGFPAVQLLVSVLFLIAWLSVALIKRAILTTVTREGTFSLKKETLGALFRPLGLTQVFESR